MFTPFRRDLVVDLERWGCTECPLSWDDIGKRYCWAIEADADGNPTDLGRKGPAPARCPIRNGVVTIRAKPREATP